MRSIEFSNISKYRSALMGIAIIIVIFFHVCGSRHDTIAYCFSRCGNIGVDIFLLLSGMGLWFSYTKTPVLSSFFYRRMIRIYPAWLIMASAFYIPNYLNAGQSSYSSDIFSLILNIVVGWSFWTKLDLTFWYIPATMMLYLFTPAYIILITRYRDYRWMPALAMVLCVLVTYWSPLHHTVGHLEIFFSRIPIFLIGINIGEYVQTKRTLEADSIWFVLLVMLLSGLACINFEDGLRGRFPLFLERMVYIPLTFSMVLVISHYLHYLPMLVNRFFAFIGTISLEVYLIHDHFVLCYIRPYQLGFWGTTLVTLAIAVVAAWILHTLLDKLLIKHL